MVIPLFKFREMIEDVRRSLLDSLFLGFLNKNSKNQKVFKGGMFVGCMAKIYELTTNERDNYVKYWVMGVNSDAEGKALARKVFGKEFYWDAGGAVSFYDRTEDAKKRGVEKYWMTKSEFLRLKKEFDRRQ